MIPANKNAIKMIKQSLYDDIAILVEHDLIKDPDYYMIGAMPGGNCDGSSVRHLIRNFAEYVRQHSKGV